MLTNASEQTVRPVADYSKQNLRGRNFKGKDLRGANFAGADIRGANFSKAQLQRADFTGAKAGVQRRWYFAQLTIGSVLSFAFNFISVLINVTILDTFFSGESVQEYMVISRIALAAVLIFTYWTILRQGLTVQSLNRVMIVFMSVGAFASLGTLIYLNAVGGGPAFISSFLISIIFAFISIVAATITIMVTAAIVDVRVFTVVGLATMAALPNASSAIAFMLTVTVLSLSSYISWRVHRGDEKFTLVRELGIAFGAIGGTSFQGADLANAIFINAQLRSSNFNDLKCHKTQLTNVCWRNAKNLEKSRLGNSILADQKVLMLLTTGFGAKENYSGLNFHGANLEEAKLNSANFTNANLNQTNLRGADLQYAILTEAQVLGSDLRKACLTGACLENWNIDASTKLDDIECRYIYLLAEPNQNGTRERRPHDPDTIFADGDFSNLYQKVVNTVEILLKDGYRNAAAYSAALQTIITTNPNLTLDSLQSIKRVGQHDAQITLTVSPKTDKADLEKQFQRAYKKEIRRLRGRIDELQALRATDMKELALLATQQKSQVTIQANQTNGDNTMTEQNNQAISTGSGSNINTGNQTGNTIAFNLGTISGNLTNTLTQLQSSNQPPSLALANHLTQLKSAIESDTALPDTDKAETLQKVEDLAKAGTTPEDTRRHGAAKSAIDFLKGTITALPKATAFAEACHKLLPLISTALKGLGLPL